LGPCGPWGPYSSVNSGIKPILNFFYPGILVNQTAPVATSGTYYLSASVLLEIDAGDTGGDFCYTTTADNFPTSTNYGGSSLLGGAQSASMTDVFFMNAGDSAEVWCYDVGSGNGLSYVYNSNITATLINSAFDANPQRAKNVPPPGTSKR
jgi:hypothetical protein